MSGNKLQKTESILLEDAIENKEDVVSLTSIFFKNMLGQVPVLNVFTGTMADYYDLRVTKRREKEITSCLTRINKLLEGVKLKQEAIDYFEKSLVFRLEDITAKLIANPDKGFDEILSTFVVSSLVDLETPPDTKDFILSTLLTLDKVDLQVFKELDRHFVENLNQFKIGVTRDSLHILLSKEGLDKIAISRSIQRLQSQYLIQPYSTATATIQEAPEVKELYEGKRSSQFDAPGGFVNTDYGRIFLRFLGLSS